MTSRPTHTIHRINCSDVAKHVQVELDQRLSLGAFKRIKAHLRNCPNCAAYLDSLKRIVLLYRNAPPPRLPKKRRERLFAALKLGMRSH
jgi:predicted anti-sigma-YlaC factor YlaD